MHADGYTMTRITDKGCANYNPIQAIIIIIIIIALSYFLWMIMDFLVISILSSNQTKRCIRTTTNNTKIHFLVSFWRQLWLQMDEMMWDISNNKRYVDGWYTILIEFIHRWTTTTLGKGWCMLMGIQWLVLPTKVVPITTLPKLSLLFSLSWLFRNSNNNNNNNAGWGLMHAEGL